jgi:hypothetical protein
MKRLPITVALMLLLALPLMAGADDQGWMPPEWTATPPAQQTSKAGQQGSRLLNKGMITPRAYARGAFAQERPASAQPENAGRLSVAEASSRIPWDTILWVERRYKIEAVRFKAEDETGIDWPFSDEVMVGTFDAKGETVSDTFGDVDSGETRDFDPAKSCIVAVRPGEAVLNKASVCDDAGEPAPLGFEVEFWEKGFSAPWAPFCVSVKQEPPYHYGPHPVDDCNGDDFIGRRQLDFTMQELEAALPNVGDERIETVKLSPCRKDEYLCGGNLPDYTFTYRVTRLPNVSVGLSSVLDEAMSKIGARSELEAIVAGLRSLRAPSPRKIEPENGRNGPILSRVGPARHGQ